MPLFPHQNQCLDVTDGLNRVAYYLDMGLGKTYVGGEKIKRLAAIPNLLVCQKSKIGDWIEHLVDVCNLDTYDLTDKKELAYFMQCATAKPVEGFSAPVIGVINYDLVWRRKQLLNLENFTLCLDESSLIQNETAKRTKFILKMNPLNVILLSGTPTAGKYENLWSQIRLLGWEITQKVYNRQYVNWKTIDVGGFPMKIVDKDDPYKNIDRLKAKMRQHGAVFMKTEEVFDLPAQNIIEVKVKTTKEYRQFQRKQIVQIDGVELIGDTTLTKRIYSKMLCGQYNADKLNAFRDLCSSTNDRLIVFYNFDAELEALRNIALELEKPVSEINGHTKDLTAYDTAGDSITLVQYKAGAMGLNLQKANKVIYFTLTDEAELFLQSMKRIHRIGQEKPCFYYLMLCENSIEDEEILPTLGIRKDYTDELFKETDTQK